ncbi:hypothetical protein [Bradyrhizobium manausense]|uniref:Uncharacterized protein n=1 Tax=Bradyrhizobium manausense TaxID=989370 RepID=A0A0R3E6Q3_9BRAD|nr:hypothetical protein [Bradyrhizobium manausense]KRQ15764.1 hypothetical protein AOQ71_07635 [Bradyrhizobium manausense]
MIAQTSEETIELRVDDIAQLFHTLDPFPFRERDLDREAEEYIVGWARELSGQPAIRIRVHHPDTDTQAKAALVLREAFGHYFADRANATQRDINELFKIGRWSLAIGLAILITCLLLAHVVVGSLFGEPLRRLLEESLLILGWVANWRPLEIFLYDWWPLVRRRDLYRRLSKAVIETRPIVQSDAGIAASQHG